MMKLKMLVCMLCLFVAGTANAGITADNLLLADGVNTVRTDGLLDSWYTATDVDGFWWDRGSLGVWDDAVDPLLGAIDKAYQGQNKTTPDDSHCEIVTTISGLTAGTSYDVWVIQSVTYSASGGTQGFDAAFGLIDPMVSYTDDVDGVDVGLDASHPAAWFVQEVLIGTAVADATGNINVRLDATFGIERTVYHGLAYSVVPEPATMLMLGLGGGIGLLRRKRNGQ